MNIKQLTAIFVFFITIYCPSHLLGQDMEYSRAIIEELCSPQFHGRAYTKKGDKKAAKLLSQEFQNIGLHSYSNDYMQKFGLNINTFPSKMEVIIDENELVPGVDFIVQGGMPSCKGEYEILSFNKLNISIYFSKFTVTEIIANKFIILDTTGFSENQYKHLNEMLPHIKGIIQIQKKLSFSISTQQQNIPIIYVKENVLGETPKTIKLNIKSRFIENYITQNVIGFLPGEIDSMIIFTAHYDHVGIMGNKTYFPGAHDNASGTAMVLNLAKHYAQIENRKYTIVFMLFSGEEAGLLGSKYFCEKPLFELSKIKFLTNLDMLGSGEEGIKVVNATEFPAFFSKLQTINETNNFITKIEQRGSAANSDHYYFYINNVPCFFIYTLGKYSEYHNIYDTSAAVPLNTFTEIFKLLTHFTSSL